MFPYFSSIALFLYCSESPYEGVQYHFPFSFFEKGSVASSDATASLFEVSDCLSQLLKDSYSDTCSLKLFLADNPLYFSKPWLYCASKKRYSNFLNYSLSYACSPGFHLFFLSFHNLCL